jgi:uncharacterized membrane protein YbhN (UPF0104 family)
MSEIALGDRLASWTRPVRLVVTWAVPLVLVGVLVWRWRSVYEGTRLLGDAGWPWLVAAAVSVVATWAAGAFSQMGATTAQLPVVRVFATQVAGSFVNHVLPSGLGLVTVNLRMLRRCGVSRGGAVGAVSLNAAVGFAVRVAVLFALLAVRPGIAHLSRRDVLAVGGAVVLVVAVGVVVSWLCRHRWRPEGRVRTTLAALWTILRRPDRAVLLWAGSAAVPALHVVTLTLVLRGLGQSAPMTTVAVAYLGAAAVSTLIPSPSGFGAFDVALLAALTECGLPATAALAAVIVYRLLSAWLPVLPGAAMLVVLLRRGVI